MAETITVRDGRARCRGTIKKGGLAGKECRRTLLIKDPELGWGILCDRSPDFHPLRSILRDLTEQNGLEEQVSTAPQNQKNNKEEEMTTNKVADILNMVKGLNIEEREELTRGIEELTRDVKEFEEVRLETKEKIINLLTEVLRRAKAGELSWSKRLEDDEGLGGGTVEHFSTTLGSVQLTVNSDNDGVMILLPNGKAIYWEVRLFSKERRLCKEITKAARKSYEIALIRKSEEERRKALEEFNKIMV